MPQWKEAAITTPAGVFRLAAWGGRLAVCAVENNFDAHAGRVRRHLQGSLPSGNPEAVLRLAEEALCSYFSGKDVALRAIPLQLAGAPFHVRVWREMRRLRAGERVSYRELASRCGCERGARAAAQACAANPLLVFVPCHRIVRSDGSLGGFSAPIRMKQQLQALERDYR